MCSFHNISKTSLLSDTGCDSWLWSPLCSAVTLCPLASMAPPPTAACHYSAFNHLLEGERVCGWGLKQQWLHLSTSGHFCCHQISVFMGHNVDSSFFFFSSLGTKPQKASKCFSFYKEKEACLWMIFDSVLAHSIKGLGKTFKNQ